MNQFNIGLRCAAVLSFLLLTACSQTITSPTSTRAAPEAVELLAKATGDETVRQYLANQFAKDGRSSYPKIAKELLHSDEFYKVLANALEDQGEAQTLERVEVAFSALPYAYLMGSGDVKSWNPAVESPLVTHLYEGDEVRETITALDADLSPYALPTDRVPEEGLVLVLFEGSGEDATLNVQQAKPFVCTDANHGREYTYTYNAIDTDEEGAAGISTRNATAPGWIVSNNDMEIEKRRGATAYTSLADAGAAFIKESELKVVRDEKFDFAAGLEDKKIEVEAQIKATYERLLKFTTDTVEEKTSLIHWSVGTGGVLKEPLLGWRLKVKGIVTEMCVGTSTIDEGKTGKTFDADIARVMAVDSEVTFNVSLSDIYASLTVKGNGKTYSAYHGKKLVLTPGAYTITGSGYNPSTGQQYVAVSQTINVVAGKNMSAYIYMQPQ